jgi:hypothetical protein
LDRPVIPTRRGNANPLFVDMQQVNRDLSSPRQPADFIRLAIMFYSEVVFSNHRC